MILNFTIVKYISRNFPIIQASSDLCSRPPISAPPTIRGNHFISSGTNRTEDLSISVDDQSLPTSIQTSDSPISTLTSTSQSTNRASLSTFVTYASENESSLQQVSNDNSYQCILSTRFSSSCETSSTIRNTSTQAQHERKNKFAFKAKRNLAYPIGTIMVQAFKEGNLPCYSSLIQVVRNVNKLFGKVATNHRIFSNY